MPRNPTPPRVLLPPDDRSQRTITRSRIVSYVLLVLAAVSFSLRPDLFGDPQEQPLHALLHVGRIVLGGVLAIAALAVQIVVGVRWRRNLRRAAEDDSAQAVGPPGNHGPASR